MEAIQRNLSGVVTYVKSLPLFPKLPKEGPSYATALLACELALHTIYYGVKIAKAYFTNTSDFATSEDKARFSEALAGTIILTISTFNPIPRLAPFALAGYLIHYFYTWKHETLCIKPLITRLLNVAYEIGQVVYKNLLKPGYKNLLKPIDSIIPFVQITQSELWKVVVGLIAAILIYQIKLIAH